MPSNIQDDTSSLMTKESSSNETIQDTEQESTQQKMTYIEDRLVINFFFVSS